MPRLCSRLAAAGQKGRRSFGFAPPPKAEPRQRPCPSCRGRRAALCWLPPVAWKALPRRRSPGLAPVCGGEGRKIASSSRITPCRQSAKRRALSGNTSGRPRLLMIYEGSRKGQTYPVCLSVCLSVCLIMGGNLMLSTPFLQIFQRLFAFALPFRRLEKAVFRGAVRVVIAGHFAASSHPEARTIQRPGKRV